MQEKIMLQLANELLSVFTREENGFFNLLDAL